MVSGCEKTNKLTDRIESIRISEVDPDIRGCPTKNNVCLDYKRPAE